MTIAAERHAHIQAWAASAILHSLAVTAALLLVSHLELMPSPEPFQWEVALVSPAEPATSDSPGESLPERTSPHIQASPPVVRMARPSAPAPPPPQIPPTQSIPRVVTGEIIALQSDSGGQRKTPELRDQPKAIDREPVEATTQSTAIEQRQVTVEPVLQPGPDINPVQQAQPAEPVPDANTQSVIPFEAANSVDTPVVHTAAIVSEPSSERAAPRDARPVALKPAVEVPVESQGVQTAALPTASAAPQASAEPAQPVSKAVQQAPAARADYRWLIESIGKRLAELKRYPPTARLNGWEGKVVLRAVITADGNLADVKVQKSSGHEALDEAAMESMREACPLHMRHDLGRPEIVVNIPVLYALAR